MAHQMAIFAIRGICDKVTLCHLYFFVLATDMLCEMFTNALQSKILVGIPLGEFGSMCNLHYADDLLIITTGGLEDLRIIKLIIYVFEGLFGLKPNFAKTSLFFQFGWFSS